MHRFLRPGAAVDRAVGREPAECLLGELPHIVGLDIAGNHQDGVIRRVEASVKRQRILAIERLDFVLPADNGNAVRMVGVERGHHLLLQDAAGIVVDAGAALFEDDLALGVDVLLGEAKIGHAVGFHRHHLGQAILGHALEIGGHVVIGEGVVLAAVLGDDLGEHAGGHEIGALEHQMFEEVRNAGRSGRLVGGADLVPDHLRHHRSAMVGDDQDLQAVGELELAYALRR
jgi:hypothetical protein